MSETFEPTCPECGGPRIIELSTARTTQYVEMVEESGDIYEYGDSDVYYETSEFIHFECRHCLHSSTDIMDFKP